MPRSPAPSRSTTTWSASTVAHAELGDVRLFFTDEGEGDPILFVHGFSCDSHDWSWQLPHFLAAGHRVIAADLRGHGRSSVPASGFVPRVFADDLAALLDHLGCGPVVAIGHSLGGVIVSALAVEHPDKVRAVVSVDPGYLVADEAAPFLDEILDAMRDGDPAAVAQGFLGATYAAASPAHLRTWHMRRIAGVPDDVLRQTFAGIFRGPDAIGFASAAAPYLRRRACPVLAFYVDAGRAAVEAGLFGDDRSRAVAWEGSGHWLHQERPEEFNHIVAAWLAAL
jgi:pimeloyl-ACP methyl ester carboxylesterase